METQIDYKYPLWRDGRGPEIKQVHYDPTGTTLKAIDFLDAKRRIGHVVFARAQAFMFTPEEVDGSALAPSNWRKVDGVAVSFLGKSPWLQSFNPHHLAKCQHFRLMFYDHYLDVVCEEISVREGHF